MGGSSSSEVKETSYEKAAAEIANKQWNLYQDELSQYEDTFMDRVDNYNSESNMANVKQDTDVAYAGKFSDSRQNLASSMTASGVDPSSGKFKEEMANSATAQAIAQGDTVNKVQSSEQDKYIAGLQDVTSIGVGQQATALSGLSDVANMSASQAASDAENDFNTRSANQQVLGAVSGAGLRSYQNYLDNNANGSVSDWLSGN